MPRIPQPETILLNNDMTLLQALALGHVNSKTEDVMTQPLPNGTMITSLLTTSGVRLRHSPETANYLLQVTGPETPTNDPRKKTQALVTWHEEDPESGVVLTRTISEDGEQTTAETVVLTETKRKIVDSLTELLMKNLIAPPEA